MSCATSPEAEEPPKILRTAGSRYVPDHHIRPIAEAELEITPPFRSETLQVGSSQLFLTARSFKPSCVYSTQPRDHSVLQRSARSFCLDFPVLGK